MCGYHPCIILPILLEKIFRVSNFLALCYSVYISPSFLLHYMLTLILIGNPKGYNSLHSPNYTSKDLF